MFGWCFFLCLGGGGLAYFYLFINFVAGVCVCVCVFISISVKSLVGSAQILMMMMEEISQTTLIAPSKWWDKPTTYAQVKHAVLLHHPSFVWEVNALSIQKLFCVQPNHFFMHLLWSPKGLTLGEFANKKLVSNNQSLKRKRWSSTQPLVDLVVSIPPSFPNFNGFAKFHGFRFVSRGWVRELWGKTHQTPPLEDSVWVIFHPKIHLT